MASLRTLAVTLAAVGLLASGVGPAVAAPPAAGAPADAPAGAMAKGAGATFPKPVYVRWAALFAAETGDVVVYEGTGSGAGVKAIQAAAVAFGASDAPRDAASLRYDALVQFPTLVGGIVPVVDLPGVGPGDLVLDASTLAALFDGRIGFWDDPALLRLNPHLPLPHLAVAPVRRSDASGTTAVFVGYLAAAAKDPGAWLGRSPPELRPLGIAAEGSRGVADAVASTPGAVGYLGFDFAQERRLAYADLVNPAGRVVQPTLASIAAAAEGADWSDPMTPSLVARPGAASWPIATATYALMRRINGDAAAARTALRFFAWASRSGGPTAEDLGFVPLPESASAAARDRLRGVGDASGLPLVPQP